MESAHAPDSTDRPDAVAEQQRLREIAALASAGEVAFEDSFATLKFVFAGQHLGELFGRRDVSVTRRYDWLGYLMLTVGLAWIIGIAHPSVHYSLRAILLYLVWFGAALILVVKGAPVVQRQWVPLFRMDGNEGTIEVRSAPWQTDLTQAWVAPVEAVSEVIFASRRKRVGRGTDVETYGIFVRFDDGTVWPIASMVDDQRLAFDAATMVARRAGRRVKQVGAAWADPRRAVRVLH